jgi:hypothetical protein
MHMSRVRQAAAIDGICIYYGPAGGRLQNFVGLFGTLAPRLQIE